MLVRFISISICFLTLTGVQAGPVFHSQDGSILRPPLDGAPIRRVGGVGENLALVVSQMGTNTTAEELRILNEALKNDAGQDAINTAARALARRLVASPSRISEQNQKPAGGGFDFDALAANLGLQQGERREALRSAVIEEFSNTAIDSNLGGDDSDIVDPSQANLGAGALDANRQLDDNLIRRNDQVLDDPRNQLAQEEAKRAAREDERNRKIEAKQAKQAEKNAQRTPPPPGAPKAPPPPRPGLPPISIQGGGSGGGQPPPPPPPMPQFPPPPVFAMPPLPPQAGLSPEFIAMLAGINKTGERAGPPGPGMADILKAIADMNQQVVNSILQLGQTLLMAGAARSQITGSPPRVPNVAGQGSITARIQGFSGQARSSRVVPSPGRSPSAGTIANSIAATSPREGTVPGYGAAPSSARSIVRSKVQ